MWVIEFTDQWFVECFCTIFHLHYQISQIWVLSLLNVPQQHHSLAMLCLVKWRIEILLETLLRWWLMGLFNSQCSESSGMSQESVHKEVWWCCQAEWFSLTPLHGISSSSAFQRLPVPFQNGLILWWKFYPEIIWLRQNKKAQASGSIMPALFCCFIKRLSEGKRTWAFSTWMKSTVSLLWGQGLYRTLEGGGTIQRPWREKAWVLDSEVK